MDELTIERASHITKSDVADITNLIAALTSKPHPADAELLQRIIDSPSHVLLLARLSGKVVGMATVALLLGPAAGRKIYLDDFVADPTVQGKGVGSRLWDAVIDWGREQGALKLEFTSRPEREAAQRFYLKKGAVVRSTNAFAKQL